MQALWLGVEPADLLLYVFLPPILLDSAARIDFFVFKKARPARQHELLDNACVLAPLPRFTKAITDSRLPVPSSMLAAFPDAIEDIGTAMCPCAHAIPGRLRA